MKNAGSVDRVTSFIMFGDRSILRDPAGARAMGMLPTCLMIALNLAWASPEFQLPQQVRIPVTAAGEVDLVEVVGRLADATGRAVARPPGPIGLPINGPTGVLTRRMMTDSLGPDATLALDGRELIITLAPTLREPDRITDWQRRLDQLAARADREAKRRMEYGMHALKSYRPNDPERPTVCLVHGMNSSSGGFVHMIRPLEEAGYGVVVFDYPFNRPLEEASTRFLRDWREFHRARGETRPWAVVTHSMGALVARSYLEDPKVYAGDVATLILIGPVSQGSSLAKTQTLLQWLNSIQAVEGKSAADALAYLGDGLGEAAADILPGSAFLTALNRRPRAGGVPYHILAGDVGFMPLATRRRIEAQLLAMRSQRGLLAGLARLAPPDLPAQLDELCEGTGDGCVSIERTRLDGVIDHVTVHANHAELIRAPLFFRDPGPVVSMPYLLRWLKADLPRGGPALTSPTPR
jgi:pimeloyl-ACP methyl ester carboxylesterase